MKQQEIYATIREMTQKVTDGTSGTSADLKRMAEVAKMSGRAEHRVLYSELKTLISEANSDGVEVTDDLVKEAAEKAKRTGRVEDRVAYVAAKARLNTEL